MGDPVLHSTISTNCSTFFHASPLHYHTIPPTLLFSRVDCSASDPQGVRLFPVNCRSFLLQTTSSFLIPIVADISSLSLSLSLSLSPVLISNCDRCCNRSSTRQDPPSPILARSPYPLKLAANVAVQASP
ncbi:uncharacterized protein AKAW2_80304S [Aspergillus luchuensis]|uniref:Uncharacterized protein n=1 Tax=Aspergillus kawachii TaxID=1069201 RepID=A0A7R7WK59_ASPKA|nr:uncharacterized protein AKAW2_80304S [Aspergillus luchuensis]BCS04503.1 hypothetical protein AKAW2_80304S [Aspergillus luchuensis]